MTNRAIVTGLIFGSVGAGLPGASIMLLLTLWPDAHIDARGMILGVLYGAFAGAAIGVAFAIPSLIVGAIVGDLVRGRGPIVCRLAGTAVATLVTVAGQLIFLRTAAPLPVAAVFAAYAAVVAWLRLPWILDWRATSPAGNGSSLSAEAK